MNITVNVRGVNDAIRQLEEYQRRLKQQTDELCRRLADIGATNVSILFSRAIYTGPLDFDVDVEEIKNGYKIIVAGQSVAFVEFGTGVTYGYGHPQAAEFGVGPGTYPGQTHAMTGKGWYLPKDKQPADGTKHTYGNPPNMPMYNTAQELKHEVARIAREVFSS